MADAFIGEIRAFGFNFAPRGWATCEGQLLTISQNTALFSLLGTNYGGNGQTTFALPDLRGRSAVGYGQSPFGRYGFGEERGDSTVTLLASEMPAHAHGVNASTGNASTGEAVGNLPAQSARNVYGLASAATMAAGAITNSGGSQPHNNMSPYLTTIYCIALQGIFPPRS